MAETPTNPPPPQSRAVRDPAAGVSDVHAPDTDAMLDPARRSLADALNVSFRLLKVLLVVLIVVYIGSGVFRVDEQHVAVRLQFGEIVGGGGDDSIYTSGWHFGLPYPVGEVVQVPIAERRVVQHKAFWFAVNEGDETKEVRELATAGGYQRLDPEQDGFLLTGDAGIVHARYELRYKVVDPVLYVTHVGNEALADQVVSRAVERAMVHFVAGVGAREFVLRKQTDTVKAEAQTFLDDLRTGIAITQVNMGADDAALPLAVIPSYERVTAVESQRGSLEDEARGQYASTLSQTAGEHFRPLLDLITRYENAVVQGEDDRADELRATIDRAFRTLELPSTGRTTGAATAPGDLAVTRRIGGEAARRINEARTYATQVQKEVAAEADTFTELYDEFQRNPQVLVHRLWQDAWDEILANGAEIAWSPTGKLRLIVRGNEVKRSPIAGEDGE